MDDAAFYTDGEFEDNAKKIDEDIALILQRMEMKLYTLLYIPEGIGKGLASLEEKAPQTFRYLESQLNRLREQYLQ
jgi:hypothetical protein